MLADEFLGELDQTNVDIVLGAVGELVEKGTAIVMVEHHEDNAKNFATRIWEIRDKKFHDMTIDEWIEYSSEGEEE